MRTCRVDVCIQVPVSLCRLIFAISFSAFCPSCEDILSGFGNDLVPTRAFHMEFTCECVGLVTSNQLVRDTLQPLALRRLEMVQPKVNI